MRALDGLSFAVEEGADLGLLGPNGAGKSTAVRILTTLARADEGTAKVAGHDVRAEAPRVRSTIGVVAQRGGADREATARENLRLSGRLHGIAARSSSEPHRRSCSSASASAEAADRIVRTFSGGMERRLDIGLALVTPAARAVPGRADDRARPGGARRHVAGDRAPRPRRGHHGVARRRTTWRRPTGSRRTSRSSIAAEWWRADRPTRLSASCTATRSRWSSRPS